MRLPLLLWIVSVTDLLRAVACIADANALNSTTLYPLRPLGHVPAGVLGLASSAVAIAWMTAGCRKPWCASALFPQFLILAIGALSALHAIYAGRYADGTPIPPAQIFTDQILWVLLPIFYATAALVELRRSGVYGAT